MTMRVIVVGGGITGLVATRKFRNCGVAVTLIERTFPFGGRLRPERVDVPGYGQAVFDPRPVFLGPACYNLDHPEAPLGFPPLGLRPDEFRPETLGALRTFPVAHVESRDGDPVPLLPIERVSIEGGAKGLIDLLLPSGRDEHLELFCDTEVIALEPDGRGWRVRVRECGTLNDDRLTRTIHADAVLLTQPIPAALALLDASNVKIPDLLGDELRRVRYERTITVTAAYRGPAQLPAGGAVSFSDSPLALVFDNYSPGPSPPGPAVTAVANADWAAEHWEESDEEISRTLLPLIAPWAGGELVWHRVQRRDHYRATSRIRMPFAEASDAPPLLIAGDGFAGYVSNALDAAYTSATHAVTHLCRALGREARIANRPTRRTPSAVSLEVCVTSAAEAHIAIGGGADRLLLCAAPEVGGLTPTVDALRLTRRAVAQQRRAVPVTVLIRPRVGGFGYSSDEFEQMRRDARRLLKAGADGIAFGFLHARGAEVRIDAERCRSLAALAHGRGRTAVFNRAFDCLTDRRTGLQDLLALKFDRVYTSGARRLALDGTSALAEAVGYGGWDIEVVAAGGLTAGFVGCVVRETGCRHVLVGQRRRHKDPTASHRLIDTEYGVVDGARLSETTAALRRAERDDELASGLGLDEDEECGVPVTSVSQPDAA